MARESSLSPAKLASVFETGTVFSIPFPYLPAAMPVAAALLVAFAISVRHPPKTLEDAVISSSFSDNYKTLVEQANEGKDTDVYR